MKIFGAKISYQVLTFLKDNLSPIATFENANSILFDSFKINDFFETHDDFQALKETISDISLNVVCESDRTEYGDFQTNIELATKVVNYLFKNEVSPEIVIEPTCGKGNFIVASLSRFKTIKKIIGIEIFKPYVWETKFNILDFSLSNPNQSIPEIDIIHASVFDYNFKKISSLFPSEKLLIIGNPPWVTNSKLGSLNSSNLPNKSNFKNQNGLDAMTGKGNFDIAEYISLMLFEAFQNHSGHLALLVKNTVIKNIVYDQKNKRHNISRIEKFCIDSKKEFNVSVEAALLLCQFNTEPSLDCTEFDFYSLEKKSKFGWLNSKFVSNIDDYNENKNIDGICPFEWRQGIKHDCSSVMELEKEDDAFVNKLSETVSLEEELVYGILKSSDLKNTLIKKTRKFTIVTQSRVGQDTLHIKQLYPKTYAYLSKHISLFNARKSSIYKGKPLFSIFGIGEYSFKPFKVAISGLYKTFHFTLVLPQNNKPVMLDDTCYFIGFDKLDYAVYSIILLNNKKTEDFLKSITFSDAKRVFTKDLLMRIDMLNIATSTSQEEIEYQLLSLNEKYNLNINLKLWNDFLNEMTPIKENQLSMFFTD